MALTGFNEENYLQDLLTHLQSSVPSKTVISVISDPHYFAPSLGTTGTAFEAYLAADRKMIAESDAILQSALEMVKAEPPNILLIPGDLTKDGEKVSHEAFAAYLAEIENTGVQVYVIPGNHDINNPHAKSYSGDTATSVDSVTPEQFASIYDDFGYGEALYRDPNSLSYVAEAGENLWILGIDSCEYDTNITDGSPETDGSLSPQTRAWVLDKLAEAKLQGITVIGMMHHNLVEHYSLQDELFGDYVIDDSVKLANDLAEAGLGMIFTGHYHANDIVKVSESGLYEVETGSLVTWPSPVRTVTIDEDGSVDITSTSVTAIDYDLGGAASFEVYATEYLMTGLNQLAAYYLMSTFGISLESASQVAPLFAAGMAAHYKGDESPDQTVLASITQMAGSGDAMQVQLAGALQSLWTDSVPADNTAAVSFTDFWSEMTIAELKELLAASYSLTPQQHYEIYGESMGIYIGTEVLLGSLEMEGAEITAYHEATNTAFVIGGDDKLFVVSLADPANPSLVTEVELEGNSQSVAINNDGLIAVAVDQEATVGSVRGNGSTATYHANGLVQFFTYDGSSVTKAGQVSVGSLPDSLAFNEAGDILVTANEGEPNMFYGEDDDAMDPVGSISVINVNTDNLSASVVTTLDFSAWNDQLEKLRNKGVRISGDDDADGIEGNLVAQDIEPEYVAISGTTAYVSLQENNAIAVVDLTTKTITDIFPAGMKDWGLGTPEAESYAFSITYPGERPDFDNDGKVDDGEVTAGGLSGLWYDGKETIDGVEYDIYYSISDRGPQAASIGERDGDNPSDPAKGGKIFDDPDFPITIYKLGKADGEVVELGSTTLKVPDGSDGFRNATGIGMLDRNDAAYELTGVDADGYNTYGLIGKDQFGLDTESVLRIKIDGLNSGNPVFAIADEYGPQIAIFDAATGNMIKRIVPSLTDFAGASNISHADIPAYTLETLPSAYSTIFNNRGFEGMAFNSDDGLLYAFIQSPLRPKGYENLEVTRIVAVDPLTGEAKHEYLYALSGEAGQDKIGDAVYNAEKGVFYVIERDSSTTSIANKSIFEVDLSNATDVLDYTNETNEKSWDAILDVDQPEFADVESLADALAGEVRFAYKNEVLNIPSLGIDPRFDKAEGLALKDDGSIVVAFDNDFIHVDGRPDNMLVEISFNELSVDTSDEDGVDEDGVIDPGSREFYGLRMPDGIDTFDYNGETFIVMANEGDGRVRPDSVNFVVPEGYNDKYLKIVDEVPTGYTAIKTLEDPLSGEVIYIIEVAKAQKDDDNVEKVGEGDEFFLTLKYGWKEDDDYYSDEKRLSKYKDKDEVLKDSDSYDKGEMGRLKTVETEVYQSEDAAKAESPDEIIAFGGRSMSIMDSNGNIVYDSGDLIEQAAIAAGVYDDGRSDDKGTEPENIVLTEVHGHTHAYVALERVNSVVVFDVTNPYNVDFLELIDVGGNTDFVAPEGITVAGGMLLVSNEGTDDKEGAGLAVYSLPTYTLQLLHFADAEAGLLASQTAPNLAALVDKFEDEYQNSITLAGGDNFIPGPFLAAGTDTSVIDELNDANGSSLSSTATVPIGAVDIAIHNAIGVEASAIGNHEFDLGSRVLKDAFTSSTTGADFPYISANLDFSGDADLKGTFVDTTQTSGLEEASTLNGKIVPSAVITENGEKIGLVGATTQLLETISSPSGTEVKGFTEGIEMDNMALLADQLQPVINDLIAQGVNKIILMSHLQVIANEKSLAGKLSGVDIILAAGSNTRLGDTDDVAVAFAGHAETFADTYPLQMTDKDGKTTLIVNTDNEFTYLGRLVVDFDINGNIITSSLRSNVSVNGAYAATDANVAAAWGVSVEDLSTTVFAEGTRGDEVESLVEAVQEVIDVKDGNVYGYSDVYLEGERATVRSEETNLGSLSSDANAYAAKLAMGDTAAVSPYVVSLKNGGGIRAQIGTISSPDPVDGTVDKLPPTDGSVSQLDVENSLRFNNQLIMFDTTAEGLKAILEHGVAAGTLQGRFPQIGGISFSWDPDFSAGSRVSDIALIGDGYRINLYKDGVKLDSAPVTISMVTLSYLANGGDGYPMKANGENFRYITVQADGSYTLSAAVDEDLNLTLSSSVPDAASVLGEQAAFETYMEEFHATAVTAYDQPDTPASEDLRIQNLNERDEAVMDVVLRDSSVHVTLPIDLSFSSEEVSTAGLTSVQQFGLLVDQQVSESKRAAIKEHVYSALKDNSGSVRFLSFKFDDGGKVDDDIEVRGSADEDEVLLIKAPETTDGSIPKMLLVDVNIATILGAATVDSGLSTIGSYLTGDDESQTFEMGSGNDTIYAAGGNDSVNAGAGDDSIIGGSGEGDDTYEGGVGSDSITYTSALDDITIDLADGTAYSTNGNNAANIGTDVLLNIEDVIAGNYDDTIIGNDADNNLDGVVGDDTITGGAGDDTITGGAGDDTAVYAGDFDDYEISYDSDSDTYTIKDVNVADGDDGTDTVTEVEHFRFLEEKIDIIAPTVQSFLPAAKAEDVEVDSDIVLNFSEAVEQGAGTIAIHSGSSTGAVVASTEDDSLEVSFSNDKMILTLDPAADLIAGSEYYVTFEHDSIRDLAGNSYDEDETPYSFTTEAAYVGSSSDGGDVGAVLAGVAGVGLLAWLIL
ncbi:MAG: esterase-like activity of phytase family protein [Chlorobium phaeovibrioides]|nr:esterase-like activity of phytase family protein [Chlorobium phaeovibrioides]